MKTEYQTKEIGSSTTCTTTISTIDVSDKEKLLEKVQEIMIQPIDLSIKS
jgi:hypothetical protein